MQKAFLVFLNELGSTAVKPLGWIILVSFAVLYFTFTTGNFSSSEVSKTLLGLGNPEPLLLFVAIGLFGTAIQFLVSNQRKISRIGGWMRSFGFDGLHLIISVLLVFSIANHIRGHADALDSFPQLLLFGIALTVVDSFISFLSTTVEFFPVRLLVSLASLIAAHIIT